jgi:hypothetical protein
MSVPPQRKRITATDRHLAAVSRSLGWAQESAERGDYSDALAWVKAVEATGSQLPPGYHNKRQVWLEALDPQPRERREP